MCCGLAHPACFLCTNAPSTSAYSPIIRISHSLSFNISVLENSLSIFLKTPEKKLSQIINLKWYNYSLAPIRCCLTTSLVTNGLKMILFLWCHTSIFFCSFTNTKNKYYWRSFLCSSEMYRGMKPHQRMSLVITQLMVLGEKNDHCLWERGSYFLKDFKRKTKGNLWLLFWK